MTDYFALFGETRRPWLDPETLKKKYFGLVRERPPDAELNEAFRILSEPRLRLRHFLALEGADLSASREVPAGLADLVWNSGMLLREIDRWLLQNGEAQSALSRALLRGERAKLERKLKDFEQELASTSAAEVVALCEMKTSNPVQPNEIKELLRRHDALSYLTRLREQVQEKSFRLNHA